MGIDLWAFQKLTEVQGKGKSLLSLGYPDLLVTEAKLLETLGRLPAMDPDSDRIKQWHSWPGPIYNTDEVIKEMGFQPVYVDYEKKRGLEDIANLNRPCAFNGTFDIICDFGTTEHIFNVAGAFANIKTHAHHGTIIIHSCPLNKPNHGFYSFSPTFFVDMWQANQGEVKELVLYKIDGTVFKGMSATPESRTKRFKVNEELQVGVVVQLTHPQPGFNMPIQSKYVGAKT